MDSRVRVAGLIKPCGLRGEFLIKLFTDRPQTRFRPGARFDYQPLGCSSPTQALTVKNFYQRANRAVLALEEVATRSRAQKLSGGELWIEVLPQELLAREDDWYDFCLVGLRVYLPGLSEPVGVVERVEHLPAQDLLVVRTGDREVWAPMARAILQRVDMEGGAVYLDPPGGMF